MPTPATNRLPPPPLASFGPSDRQDSYRGGFYQEPQQPSWTLWAIRVCFFVSGVVLLGILGTAMAWWLGYVDVPSAGGI
jgi:hypothetical protein